MPTPESGHAPRVSVVVITRDRPQLLEKCIRSIVESDFDDWEMVVLDNGSGDPVVESPDRRVRRVTTEPDGFARMRQLAAEQCRGEFLLSIDDDCVAEPDAISQLVQRFESDPSIGVIGGRLENVGFTGADRYKGRGRFTVNGLYEPCEDPEQAEVFGGANASFRRRAVEEAGGYDPYFSDGLEDADVVLSVRELGYRVVYDPDVRVTHYHSPARFRRLGRNIHRMRLYLFFKHFPPAGLAQWLGFFRRELGLLLNDSRDQLRAFTFRPPQPVGFIGYPVWLSKRIVLRAIELGKVFWARLAIPAIARQAGRRRRGPA